MKLSIITATYNSEKTLARCLDSVANQTAINEIEHIIIDGRSTDKTLEIASDYPHVKKIISEKDRGIYHAFNKGAEYATGEFIYYLNSDDYLYDSGVISEILSQLHLGVDYYCGTIMCEDPNTGETHLIPSKKKDPSNFKPRHQAFFCRREIFNILGGFNECLSIAADTYFMKNVIKKLPGIFTDKIVCRFQLDGFSTDQKNRAKVYEQDLIVDSLLKINKTGLTIAGKLAKECENTQAIQNLFIRHLDKKLSLCKLINKSVVIFGTRELSLIFYRLLKENGVDPVGFCVSEDSGYIDKTKDLTVYGLKELSKKNIDIIINCVQGNHESEVAKIIKLELPAVAVLSWRDF